MRTREESLMISAIGEQRYRAIQLRKTGQSYRQIAKELDKAVSTVWAWLNGIRDSKRRGRIRFLNKVIETEIARISQRERDAITIMLACGMDFQDVAKAAGISVEAVKAFDESIE